MVIQGNRIMYYIALWLDLVLLVLWIMDYSLLKCHKFVFNFKWFMNDDKSIWEDCPSQPLATWYSLSFLGDQWPLPLAFLLYRTVPPWLNESDLGWPQRYWSTVTSKALNEQRRVSLLAFAKYPRTMRIYASNERFLKERLQFILCFRACALARTEEHCDCALPV